MKIIFIRCWISVINSRLTVIKTFHHWYMATLLQNVRFAVIALDSNHRFRNNVNGRIRRRNKKKCGKSNNIAPYVIHLNLTARSRAGMVRDGVWGSKMFYLIHLFRFVAAAAVAAVDVVYNCYCCCCWRCFAVDVFDVHSK